MKEIFKQIKRWIDLSHPRPWEEKPPNWEDTAPSEYEPSEEE